MLCRVQGVKGAGCKGAGCRVQGTDFKGCRVCKVHGVGCEGYRMRVQSSRCEGFQMWDVGHIVQDVRNVGCKVWVVQGAKCGVQFSQI